MKKRFTIRRFVAGMLAAVICGTGLSLGAIFASAEDEDTVTTFTDGTLTYTVTEGYNVAVTGCEVSAPSASVLPSIDGYNIVAIADEAFANCTELMGISIADTVTSIGEAAFYGCSALTEITIPDSVTEIGAGCFFGCSSLTDVTLGAGLTDIGDMAFGYCTALPSIEIPDGITDLGNQLFYYCVSLQNVTLPNTMEALGAYTFYGCISLTSIHLPATMDDYGAFAFLGCSSLSTVTIDEENEYFCVEDDVLYDAAKEILCLYPAGKSDTSFTVPDSVLVIYAGSFFAASSLESIDLANVQYIGEMAFDFCSGLTSLTIPAGVTTIGTTAFSDCTSIASLTIEEDGDELAIGEYAFFCNDSLKDVTLPSRVTTIGSYAFGCTEAEEETSKTTTILTDSGETIIIAPIDDFTLTGDNGAARSYAKDCDVKIYFHATEFDWQRLVFWICFAIVILLILFVAVGVIRRTMRTKAEVAADASAAASVREETRDDGYRSIVEDDEDEPDISIPNYDETLSHGAAHQFGHASDDDHAGE